MQHLANLYNKLQSYCNNNLPTVVEDSDTGIALTNAVRLIKGLEDIVIKNTREYITDKSTIDSVIRVIDKLEKGSIQVTELRAMLNETLKNKLGNQYSDEAIREMLQNYQSNQPEENH